MEPWKFYARGHDGASLRPSTAPGAPSGAGFTTRSRPGRHAPARTAALRAHAEPGCAHGDFHGSRLSRAAVLPTVASPSRSTRGECPMMSDVPTDRIVEMSYPTRIVFGPGALERVPAQVDRLGMKRPLVVTDAGIVKAGLAKRLYDVLSRARVA